MMAAYHNPLSRRVVKFTTQQVVGSDVYIGIADWCQVYRYCACSYLVSALQEDQALELGAKSVLHFRVSLNYDRPLGSLATSTCTKMEPIWGSIILGANMNGLK